MDYTGLLAGLMVWLVSFVGAFVAYVSQDDRWKRRKAPRGEEIRRYKRSQFFQWRTALCAFWSELVLAGLSGGSGFVLGNIPFEVVATDGQVLAVLVVLSIIALLLVLIMEYALHGLILERAHREVIAEAFHIKGPAADHVGV